MSQNIYYTKIYTKESAGFLSGIHMPTLSFLGFVKRVIEVTIRTALIVTFIVTAITVITSNTDYLFGIKSYTVLTGSMEPTIPTGSIIYTTNNLGYNIGDIITYKTANNTLVTHRVVGVMNTGEVQYVTKGDANASPDATIITSDKIIGKTYLSIPFIGRISGMLKTPTGLFTVVFLPAIVIVLFELWNIKKEIEKSVENRILKKLKEQEGAHTHFKLWSESLS